MAKSKTKSVFMAIGGGSLTNADDILDRIFELLGSDKDPRLVIMTAATQSPKEAVEKYNSMFRRRGLRHVDSIDVSTREDAFNETSAKKIEEATAVFFTGGDQMYITTLFGGSPLDTVLRKRIESGLHVFGTSAGAAMMSSSMIMSGRGDVTPGTALLDIGPGMNLIENTLIDTHFSQRGRHGRLLCAVAHNPAILALGIDESTAIVVQDGKFEVLGLGSVTVVDGSKMSHNDRVMKAEKEPIGLFDINIHVLPRNYEFDMEARRPVPIEGAKPAAA